jgi:hypothetical protein
MRVYVSALILLLVSTFALLGASQTLRRGRRPLSLLVSTAVPPAQLSEPAYASTLAPEFNSADAEDAMKWSVLRPDEATFDFRQGDEIVRFAQATESKSAGIAWPGDAIVAAKGRLSRTVGGELGGTSSGAWRGVVADLKFLPPPRHHL